MSPAGERETFGITGQGTEITPCVHGAVINRWIGCQVPRGSVGIEAEGYRIESRNVKLEPIDGAGPAKWEKLGESIQILARRLCNLSGG